MTLPIPRLRFRGSSKSSSASSSASMSWKSGRFGVSSSSNSEAAGASSAGGSVDVDAGGWTSKLLPAVFAGTASMGFEASSVAKTFSSSSTGSASSAAGGRAYCASTSAMASSRDCFCRAETASGGAGLIAASLAATVERAFSYTRSRISGVVSPSPSMVFFRTATKSAMLPRTCAFRSSCQRRRTRSGKPAPQFRSHNCCHPIMV